MVPVVVLTLDKGKKNEIQFCGRCYLPGTLYCGLLCYLPILSELCMIKTMEEALELYEQMLDEAGPVVVGGIEFSPSAILKEMDPIAYDTGFNDYMDSCDVDTDDLLEDDDSDYDDSMDGDFDSGMASAGYGTDEDYGYYGD